MSSLAVSTDRTPLLERRSEYGTQSGQEEEVRTESIGTRIFNALAWFFNMINPFSCCMSSAQDVEVSNQADAMERGELAGRVNLPAPTEVREEPQVQREKKVVAKPVDFPAERAYIRKLERGVKKLESRLAQIDRELKNPGLKETSTYGVFKMLEDQSTMDDLVGVLGANRRIEGLTGERLAVQQELAMARADLQGFRKAVNLPEVS